MNPLTLVKRIQKINSREASLGISEEASWHAKYKDSAYVFVGGIPFQLTEGDLLAVFAQYGEVVDVNLVRDKATGKSKGFAFLAYEDQRSTTLAVDNLNGAKVLGRVVRVDHVSNYKKKEEEDEEEENKKREARGVCYAFQKGECNRGAGCKFSHDQERNANTGAQDANSRWDHDMHEGPRRSWKKSTDTGLIPSQEHKSERKDTKSRPSDNDGRSSRIEDDEVYRARTKYKDQDGRGTYRSSDNPGRGTRYKDDREKQTSERCSIRSQIEPHRVDDRKKHRSEKRSRHEYDEDSSYRHRRDGEGEHIRR